MEKISNNLSITRNGGRGRDMGTRHHSYLSDISTLYSHQEGKITPIQQGLSPPLSGTLRRAFKVKKLGGGGGQY